MIIVEPDNEKAGQSNINGMVPTTQLFYVGMPEPDLSHLSNRLGTTMRISEHDAPPAYEQVTRPQSQNVASSSAQPHEREGTIASSSFVRSFEPLVLHSRGKRLHEGFYTMLPPTDIIPHPFAQREVTTEDWKKFLNELQEAAKLVNGAPTTSSAGEPPSPSPIRDAASRFLTTFKANHRLERASSGGSIAGSSPSVPADPSSLIDYWNTNIFHPRGIDVVLAKGPRRLSGDRTLPPPDYEPLVNQSSTSSLPVPLVLPGPSVPARGYPIIQPPQIPMHTRPCQSVIGASCRGRARCGNGWGRNRCGGRHRSRSVSSSSSSSESGDDAVDSNAGRGVSFASFANPSGAPPTTPSPFVPAPHVPAEGPSRTIPSGTNTSTNAQLPSGYAGIPFDALPPRAQQKIERWQKRQERKGERLDKRLARKYTKLEHKLEKKGLYLSPLLPVDMAMHGVGMGLGLGMRGVGLGMGLGLRGIGMGLRGVGIGIRGGKAPMGEAALAEEEDGYYRLIVTDLSRVSA